MASYNPSTRPEHIDALISGVDRYNPHNLPLLHDYLDAQLKGEYDWDCMAALAVLKLYQFNPTTFTYPMVISLLAKSLHAIPSPDFNLCLALLGEAPVSILPQKSSEDAPKDESSQEGQTTDSAAATTTTANAASSSSTATTQQPSAGILTDPTILKLNQLATLLSSSRYPTFWTALQSSEFDDIRAEVLKDIVDFEDGVRRVVLNGTSGAFKSITRQRLARYLGLNESQVEQFLQTSQSAQGWTVKADGVVEIPANKDNVVKPAGVVREDVGLSELNKLLQQAAPSAARA